MPQSLQHFFLTKGGILGFLAAFCVFRAFQSNDNSRYGWIAGAAACGVAWLAVAQYAGGR
jgi:hypothetical protein